MCDIRGFPVNKEIGWYTIMKKSENESTVWMKVINVIVVLICLVVLIVAVAAITNSVKGYNNVFGSTFLAVQSDSMDGGREDSFKKGDMIVAKILKDAQKKELEKDQIITFWMLNDSGQKVLNTHRIIEVNQDRQGNVYYVTQGDKAALNQIDETESVVPRDIVARYQFKMKGFGNFLLFLKSSTGFLVVIVIPSILALGYCVFLFIRNFKGYNKLKKEEEKERYKKELLQEMEQKDKK